MSLPELGLQIIYGRLAWGIVLAALLVTLLPSSLRLSRRATACLLAGAAMTTLLPGAASPAYWLILAFQWPSAFLVGFCVVRLWAAWRDRPEDVAMPAGLAAVIAVAGAVLYLDAIGLLARGMYFWGFGAVNAPLVGLILVVLGSVAVVNGYARPQAWALLGAAGLFAVLRLPTGNLWDALLDPFLWAWALGTLGHRAWRRRRAAERAPSFATTPGYASALSIDAAPATAVEPV